MGAIVASWWPVVHVTYTLWPRVKSCHNSAALSTIGRYLLYLTEPWDIGAKKDLIDSL